MPDKKRAGEPDPKPQYTTFRLYATDGEDLSELADKRGVSIAKLFRDMGFAETVRKELVKEAEQRLQDLKSRRPQ
jgi:hypothetical protein